MTEEAFRELVREMRIAQQAFFKSSPGTAPRRKALRDSKVLECRVDAVLAGQEEPVSLFAEEAIP